ncbi:hypothetical protein G7Y89_g4656 [Cudoniella acicularis]|uniref:Uncharacterized protein n=1 Tax=Cudoniella acicularis TaxID=354080 RepID=A0A8H4W4H7_9HELO|nr:hypothetical protein G7Y89_g4656 [Cudoniella acicularis]
MDDPTTQPESTPTITSTTPQNPTTLHNVPPELRVDIFLYVLNNEDISYPPAINLADRQLPALILAFKNYNKIMYSEAFGVFEYLTEINCTISDKESEEAFTKYDDNMDETPHLRYPRLRGNKVRIKNALETVTYIMLPQPWTYVYPIAVVDVAKASNSLKGVTFVTEERSRPEPRTVLDMQRDIRFFKKTFLKNLDEGLGVMHTCEGCGENPAKEVWVWDVEKKEK